MMCRKSFNWKQLLWRYAEMLTMLLLFVQAASVNAAPNLPSNNSSETELKNQELDSKLSAFINGSSVFETKQYKFIDNIAVSESLQYNNKNLLKEIIEQFEKIEVSRKIRSTCYTCSTEYKCTLAEDELTNLKNKFDAILRKILPSSDNTLQFHPINTDNCYELVYIVQCAVNNLKSGFLKAMGNEITLNIATKWEDVYKEFLENSQKEIDNIKNELKEEDKFEVFKLSTTIQESCRAVRKLRELLTSSNTKQNIDDHKLVNLDIWANNIQNGLMEDVKQFCLQNPEDFSPIFETLIKKAYSNNLKNAEKLMNFCLYLPDAKYTTAGLNLLYLQMKQNNHIDSYEFIILAYKLKEYMDKDMPAEYKYRLINIENDLPKPVHDLIWNGNCYIKNKYWGEYLFAAGIDYDGSRRRVFTWIPQPYTGGQRTWKILSRDKGRTFTIKNLTFNEYLYAVVGSDLLFSPERRRVFTWKDKSWVDPGSWRIKTVNNGKYVTLLSKDHNEYLFADRDSKYDNHRRRLFTWISKSTPGWLEENNSWELICL